MTIIVKQDDGLIWNSIPQVGILYKVSFPFLIIGVAVSFYNCIKNFKEAVLDTLFNIQFLLAIMLGLIQNANVNRINIIMIPLVYYCYRGIITVIGFAKGKFYDKVKLGIALAYLFSFFYFSYYYFVSYSVIMGELWGEGVRDALEYVDLNEVKKVNVMDISYPVVLFFTQYPTDTFVKTVEWSDDSSSFRTISEMEGYNFNDFTDSEPELGEAYVCRTVNESGVAYMKSHGMVVKYFDEYVVGMIPE